MVTKAKDITCKSLFMCVLMFYWRDTEKVLFLKLKYTKIRLCKKNFSSDYKVLGN